MIKLYICCLVLIIGSVEVGPDIDMKFHQEVMEIVSYDRKIAERKSNRLDEEKENYPQEEGGEDDVQVGTLQTDEGRRHSTLMLQGH